MRAYAEGAGGAGGYEAVTEIVRDITATEFVRGFAVFVVGALLVHFAMRLLRRAADRTQAVPATLRGILRTGAKIVLYFLVVVTAAGVMGVPVTSFVALFSIVGIAVSLGVQGLLANFVGGIIILISRPFSVSDFVETEGFTGTVTEIGMIHTRLRAPGGAVNVIPNSTLITSRLTNYSAAEKRRVELTIQAAYACPPQRVREALLSAAAGIPAVLSDPAPEVHVERYGDSGIVYTLWAWVMPADFLQTKYRLNEALYEAFRAAGIEIPFPQVVVHAADGKPS